MPPTTESNMTYYQKNKEKQKEYKLYQWYKKKHDIPYLYGYISDNQTCIQSS